MYRQQLTTFAYTYKNYDFGDSFVNQLWREQKNIERKKRRPTLLLMSTFGRTKENTNKRNRTLCKHLSHALLLLLYTTSNKLPLHTASVLHLFNYYVLTIPDSVAKCRHLLPANQITFPLKFLCEQQVVARTVFGISLKPKTSTR